MSESKMKKAANAAAPPRKEPTIAGPNASVTNPTKATDVDDLPEDAVALLVWRKFTGPQPMTIIVTRASWEENRKVVMATGGVFHYERIYEFESPVNLKGRRTTFHLQDVIGWAANVDTGIVPITD